MFKGFWIRTAVQALKMLSSGDFIRDVKTIVLYYIDKDMAGYEKKKAALRRLRTMGYNFATWIFNSAIEIVLGYYKIKSPELFKGNK